jgi:membrane protein DedA with SNARE-associated domain
MDIETIVVGFSYVGIFFLMIGNGLFSFPSSQILYIIVGYFVGTGYLALLPASFVGALGNTLGNIALYEIVRRRGLLYIERFKIFRREDIARVEVVFRKRGLWFLFVGKLLPAIKVFVPIPAALGQVHRGVYAALMFLSSWIWSFAFIGIGYFFGKSAHVWKSYGIALSIIAFIILIIFYRLLFAESVTEEVRKAALSDENKKETV